MTSEALQNPYFVRLFCIWILTKHISTYNIVKNRSFDTIKILWALKFEKRGETTLKKRGGGTDPCPPPPPKSALDLYYADGSFLEYVQCMSNLVEWTWQLVLQMHLLPHLVTVAGHNSVATYLWVCFSLSPASPQWHEQVCCHRQDLLPLFWEPQDHDHLTHWPLSRKYEFWGFHCYGY